MGEKDQDFPYTAQVGSYYLQDDVEHDKSCLPKEFEYQGYIHISGARVHVSRQEFIVFY